MEMVKVDRKGRVLIPKSFRDKVNLKRGSHVKMRVSGRTIIIEPIESIADKYFGAFKIDRWPEDLDEFLVEVMRRWWSQRST